ncbi:MAG TPA: zf-HC2 domain-containing protein, partial [Armatimonadota bacterium]
MSCRRTRRLLSAYEDGELSLKQRMAVNSHVLRCDACREAMSEGERQRKTLEDAFRQPLEAPPHLAIAVLDRLEREYPVCPAPRPLAVRWGRPLVGALGSVATAVAAVWGAVQLGTLARAPLASVPKTVTPATQPQSETSAPTFASLPPVALPEELRGAGHDPLVSAEYLKHEWSRLGQPLPKPRETKADAARPTPDEPVVVASAEAPAPAPTPAGRVSTVDGVLQVARGTRWETIAADYPVEEQARMRTGEDSLVAFELNGGVVIR